jgi:L-serine dehydratase
MNIFDIIGPVMIGPSSSHTAGVVRIGNIVKKIIGYTPNTVIIKFHGSFAKTYVGHGSDKAIIAGLMGFSTDSIEIRNSPQIAKDRGFNFSIETVVLDNAHPNTIMIESTLENNKKSIVIAESIGGGNILVKKIDDFDVDFDGQYPSILIKHKDSHGMISKVTKVLYEYNINVAQMKVYREKKGGTSMMMIESDEYIDNSVISDILLIDGVLQTTYVSGLN